jgi:hypothetical protein
MYFIQQCFIICRPSDFTVSEDAADRTQDSCDLYRGDKWLKVGFFQPGGESRIFFSLVYEFPAAFSKTL